MSPLPRRSRSLALSSLALAIACTGIGPQSEPPPEPEPGLPAPATTPSVPATKPPADEPPVAPASPLHLIALREGSIQLVGLGATPTAVLEGEPLPLVDGVPSRGPSGSRGLPTFAGYDSQTQALAVAGTLDASGIAWVSTEQEYDRAGSLHRVYRNRNQGKGWERAALRKGIVTAYHLAYVERDGALFGLQAWDRDPEQDHWDPEDDSPAARAYDRALDRALGKLHGSFVRLAGPKIAAPVLPAGTTPSTAVTTNDGTLYVLAQVVRSNTNTDVLFAWPPGAERAELVDLPDWHGYDPRLSSNGDVAMVTGESVDPKGGPAQSYLAQGRGSTWERVPVSLPGRSPKASAQVIGAARTPAGELWIAVGDPWQVEPGDQPLWRKPVDGPWQPVPLPTFGDELFGRGEGFVYDVTGIEAQGWSAIERPTLVGVTPQPTALAWIDGAMWVVLELGGAYELGVDAATPRAVLLSTAAARAEPARLPSRGELYVERHNTLHRRATPGKGVCQRSAFVLGPASLLQTRPELALAVRKAVSTAELAVDRIYVGRLDDEEVLVAGVYARSPAEAKTLRRAVAAVTGAAPVVECRIPTLVRMVQSS
jgi:hypothetical protein